MDWTRHAECTPCKESERKDERTYHSNQLENRHECVHPVIQGKGFHPFLSPVIVGSNTVCGDQDADIVFPLATCGKHMLAVEYHEG